MYNPRPKACYREICDEITELLAGNLPRSSSVDKHETNEKQLEPPPPKDSMFPFVQGIP